MPEAKSLRRLAEESGFGASDVAFLSQLQESTISRLWNHDDWLDHVSGRSLQALMAAVPGVQEYMCSYALDSRRMRQIEELADAGLVVDLAAYEELVARRGVAEQYLGNALEVACAIMRGDARFAATGLARCWGLAQDQALSHLFVSSDGLRLIADPAPLLTACGALAQDFEQLPHSFHAVIAQATVAHYTARVEGGMPAPRRRFTRQQALTYRSAVIGHIIATNDEEAAERYGALVKRDRSLTIIETWAFPTYTSDAKLSPDFCVPSSVCLRSTAAEVIREMDLYNDAYFKYLLRTAIPIMVEHDRSFGNREIDLREAVSARLARTGRTSR